MCGQDVFHTTARFPYHYLKLQCTFRLCEMVTFEADSGLAGEVWVAVVALWRGTKNPGGGPAAYGGGAAAAAGGGPAAAAGGGPAAAGGATGACTLNSGAPGPKRAPLCFFLSSCNTKTRYLFFRRKTTFAFMHIIENGEVP